MRQQDEIIFSQLKKLQILLVSIIYPRNLGTSKHECLFLIDESQARSFGIQGKWELLNTNVYFSLMNRKHEISQSALISTGAGKLSFDKMLFSLFENFTCILHLRVTVRVVLNTIQPSDVILAVRQRRQQRYVAKKGRGKKPVLRIRIRDPVPF